MRKLETNEIQAVSGAASDQITWALQNPQVIYDAAKSYVSQLTAAIESYKKSH
jgi:hypothetical protein